MYVITGGTGFIGANIVHALNERGVDDILVVDDAERLDNITDCRYRDYCDKADFLDSVRAGKLAGEMAAIVHHGACSDTMARDRTFMMENNFEYSMALLEFCQENRIPLLYASSASVYGAGNVFRESPEFEAPINLYAETKFLFDQEVRKVLPKRTAQIVGLRYFNVYGDRESHKDRMSSVAFQFFHQYRDRGYISLFEGSGDYGAGEQRRDFVFVHDVAAANLFFLDHPDVAGIFNVGTGRSQSFNDVAVAVINSLRKAAHKPALTLQELCKQGIIRYVEFPATLKQQYQNFTEADTSALRAAGYTEPFHTVEQGVEKYMQRLLFEADQSAGESAANFS